MSQIIVTDNFLRKLQTHNGVEFEDSLRTLIRLARKGSLVIFTRDVGTLITSPIINGQLIAERFSLVLCQDTITEENFYDAFKVAEIVPEKSVFISSDKQDFAVASKVGIKRSYYFTTYSLKYTNNKLQNYETIDRVETLVSAL